MGLGTGAKKKSETFPLITHSRKQVGDRGASRCFFSVTSTAGRLQGYEERSPRIHSRYIGSFATESRGSCRL